MHLEQEMSSATWASERIRVLGVVTTGVTLKLRGASDMISTDHTHPHVISISKWTSRPVYYM
jgi:hypothetical protein